MTSLSGGMGIALDLMIAGLLVAVIAYAVILNRRLMAWRQDKAEFERLIASFNLAAARAETGVERLKAASEETGKSLQQATTKGRALCDDLSYLIERAEPLADRLVDSVRASRRTGASTEVPRPSEPAAESSALQSTDEASERARAKRDLLRALAALR
jgi:hypothetical protein